MGLVKKIKRMVLWIVLLVVLVGTGAGAWFVGSHTIIQTDKGYVYREKEKFGFENNYFDVRNWGIKEYLKHPEIAQALIENGFTKIEESLKKVETGNPIGEALQKISEAL